jgi:hypothetical protein
VTSVVALGYNRGRIKGSAAPIEHQVAYIWTLRNGQGFRVHAYFSWQEALQHAGLQE